MGRTDRDDRRSRGQPRRSVPDQIAVPLSQDHPQSRPPGCRPLWPDAAAVTPRRDSIVRGLRRQWHCASRLSSPPEPLAATERAVVDRSRALAVGIRPGAEGKPMCSICAVAAGSSRPLGRVAADPTSGDGRRRFRVSAGGDGVSRARGLTQRGSAPLSGDLTVREVPASGSSRRREVAPIRRHWRRVRDRWVAGRDRHRKIPCAR